MFVVGDKISPLFWDVKRPSFTGKLPLRSPKFYGLNFLVGSIFLNFPYFSTSGRLILVSGSPSGLKADPTKFLLISLF